MEVAVTPGALAVCAPAVPADAVASAVISVPSTTVPRDFQSSDNLVSETVGNEPVIAHLQPSPAGDVTWALRRTSSDVNKSRRPVSPRGTIGSASRRGDRRGDLARV